MKQEGFARQWSDQYVMYTMEQFAVRHIVQVDIFTWLKKRCRLKNINYVRRDIMDLWVEFNYISIANLKFFAEKFMLSRSIKAFRWWCISKKDLEVSIFIAGKLTTSPKQSTSGISGYSKRAYPYW